MPLAPPDSTFKDRVHTTAYQAQEMGGLIWAYLGPEPVPLLPRLGLCEPENELRQIIGHTLPCNWLQVMENRGDQHHGVINTMMSTSTVDCSSTPWSDRGV